MSNLPAPAPETNTDTTEFWAATGQGRLTLQRCTACDTVVWYPRSLCPTCQSFDLEWFDATGLGSVYSFTVVHKNPSRSWGAVTPYVMAYVELDEGPRLLTNIVDCDPATVAVDQRVQVVWDDTGEGTALPRFTPVTS